MKKISRLKADHSPVSRLPHVVASVPLQLLAGVGGTQGDPLHRAAHNRAAASPRGRPRTSRTKAAVFRRQVPDVVPPPTVTQTSPVQAGGPQRCGQ